MEERHSCGEKLNPDLLDDLDLSEVAVADLNGD